MRISVIVFSFSSAALKKLTMTPFCFVEPSGNFFSVACPHARVNPAFITALPMLFANQNAALVHPPTASLAFRNSRLFLRFGVPPIVRHFANDEELHLRLEGLLLVILVAALLLLERWAPGGAPLPHRRSRRRRVPPSRRWAPRRTLPNPPNAGGGAPDAPGLALGPPSHRRGCCAFGNSEGFSAAGPGAAAVDTPNPPNRLGAAAAAFGGVGVAAPKSGLAFIGVPSGMPPNPRTSGSTPKADASPTVSSTSLKSVLICAMCLSNLAARRPGRLAACRSDRSPSSRTVVQRARCALHLSSRLDLSSTPPAWAARALEPAPHSSSSSAACLRFFPISLARFKV